MPAKKVKGAGQWSGQSALKCDNLIIYQCVSWKNKGHPMPGKINFIPSSNCIFLSDWNLNSGKTGCVNISSF